MNEIRLLRYLNNTDSERSFYTPSYLYQYKKYETVSYSGEKNADDYVDHHKTIGRLYSKNSLQNFPREIRYMLFKNKVSCEYRDFDIKNAHPTFLLQYAEKNMILLNGSLREFIMNREECQQRVKNELPKKTLKKLESAGETVKQEILRHMNRT